MGFLKKLFAKEKNPEGSSLKNAEPSPVPSDADLTICTDDGGPEEAAGSENADPDLTICTDDGGPEEAAGSEHANPDLTICTDDGGVPESVSDTGNMSDEWQYIRLEKSGDTAEHDVYELTFEHSHVEIRHLSVAYSWVSGKKQVERKPISEKTGDAGLSERLLQLISDCEVRQWEKEAGGKKQENDGLLVLDGGSFSFYGRLSDGTELRSDFRTANTGKFLSGLRDILERETIGKRELSYRDITLMLPESFVDRITLNYGDGFLTFTMNKEDRSSVLLRLDYLTGGYGDEPGLVRLGRIVNGKNTHFLELVNFSGFFDVKPYLSEEECGLCNDIISGKYNVEIASSIRAKEPAAFVPEDGENFYLMDAERLFKNARSFWLSLKFPADYPSGHETLTDNGRKYYSLYAKFEREPARTAEELLRKMKSIFSEDFSRKLISDMQAANSLLTKNGKLYVAEGRNPDPKKYGGFSVNKVQQKDSDHAELTVSVLTSAPEDPDYRYSRRTEFCFPCARNPQGCFVLTAFPYWDTPETKETGCVSGSESV